MTRFEFRIVAMQMILNLDSFLVNFELFIEQLVLADSHWKYYHTCYSFKVAKKATFCFSYVKNASVKMSVSKIFAD